jgi:hypothetical protein
MRIIPDDSNYSEKQASSVSLVGWKERIFGSQHIGNESSRQLPSLRIPMGIERLIYQLPC